MAQWNFMPWNMQYLGGGLAALAATIIVFRSDPKTSSSYRCFLAYGACVVAWMFSVLLGRSAPSLDASTAFYRVVMLAFFLTQPLFLVTILQIASQQRVYYLTVLPALFLTAYAAVVTTFDVYATSFGWAYSLRQQFVPISTAATLTYAAAIVTVLSVLAVKRKLLYLKKKYTVILVGFLLYFIPLSITNMSMWKHPDVRPFGGFLMATEFLFIAYALYLKPDRIEFAGGQSANALNERLFKFVRRLRELMPGKELGGDAAYFDSFLQSTGLRDAVQEGSNGQVFDANLSLRLDMWRTMDRITGFMRREAWTLRASKEYSDLFVELYATMRHDSTTVARSWLDGMLYRHGGFLDKQRVLEALPPEAELPSIFRELQRGKISVFREPRPAKAFERLNKAMEYGFDGICITKLEPQKVRTIYGIEKAAVFWLTFQQTATEETVKPNDPDRMSYILSLGTVTSGRSVALLDCLDQIILANSPGSVAALLADLKRLCKENAATFLLSIDPEMLGNEQMEAIERSIRDSE